jgi:Uma2 family endonuclease
MTRDEFFAWAERQEGRYEFDGVQPVAMVGGTNNQGTITINLLVQLSTRLRGKPCRPMTAEGGGVATVGGRIRYPDATITCSPIPGRERLVPNPVVVFEILSPTTAPTDQTAKKLEYQAVPSIRRYILIDQAQPALTIHVRPGEGAWESAALGAGAMLDLPEIGIALPVDDLYEGVSFDG